MEKAKVIFVVPCLNSGDTIEACLAHLRNQDCPDIVVTIVVVDNGSTDNTVEVANALADKVLIAPEASIAAMRNKGAEVDSSDYIGFVDSDCLLHESWLSDARGNLEDNGVGLTGSKTHILPDNSTWVAKAWKIHLDFSGRGEQHNWLATRAILVKREAFDRVGGFDESKETCEDVKLGLDIAEHYRVVVDSRLSPLHLKDANTLPELYRKEVWRGVDSVATSVDFFRSGRFRFRELLSLLLPFYFSFFVLVFVISGIGQLFGWEVFNIFLFWSAIFVVAPIILFSLRTAFGQGQPQSTPALLLVYGIYILARTRALFPRGGK